MTMTVAMRQKKKRYPNLSASQIKLLDKLLSMQKQLSHYALHEVNRKDQPHDERLVNTLDNAADSIYRLSAYLEKIGLAK